MRDIEIEKNLLDDFIAKYGWEWHQVSAHPTRLMKLVVGEILEIAYKSRRYTHYELEDGGGKSIEWDGWLIAPAFQ